MIGGGSAARGERIDEALLRVRIAERKASQPDMANRGRAGARFVDDPDTLGDMFRASDR